jgi:hypothetical protein
MNVKERTIFKEIDELLLGVFGDLTDDEILKRVADLIAQGDPEMATAAWLIAMPSGTASAPACTFSDPSRGRRRPRGK